MIDFPRCPWDRRLQLQAVHLEGDPRKHCRGWWSQTGKGRNLIQAVFMSRELCERLGTLGDTCRHTLLVPSKGQPTNICFLLVETCFLGYTLAPAYVHGCPYGEINSQAEKPKHLQYEAFGVYGHKVCQGNFGSYSLPSLISSTRPHLPSTVAELSFLPFPVHRIPSTVSLCCSFCLE